MAVDKNKIVAEATRLVQKGQYDKAIKAYQKILAEDPREVRTLLKIGEIQQRKGDVVAAATSFNQAADIYGEQGFFLKAVAVYKQVARLTPDDPRVNEKLAALYQQLGLLNDAMTQLQAVANAHERTGDQPRYLDTLRRMHDIDPENVATCARLGDLYAKAGRPAEALDLLGRAASHLRENARWEDWLRVAERIFQLTPQDLALAREMAQQYLLRGDAKKALGKLQVLHGADRRDVETLRLMARAFGELGQSSKTLAVYKALATVHGEDGRWDDAALAWRMVRDLSPEDPDAQAALEALESPPLAPEAVEAVPAEEPPAPAAPPAAAHPIPTVPRPGPPPGARMPHVEPVPVFTPAPGYPPAPAGRPSSGGFPRPSWSPPVAVPPRPGATPPPVAAPRTGGTPVPVATAAASPQSAAARIVTEADVYAKYGLHQKALDHVRKALELDPESPDALERVREACLALGDHAAAVDAAARVLRSLTARGLEQRIPVARERLRQLDPDHADLGTGSSEFDLPEPDELDVLPEPAAGELGDGATWAGEPPVEAPPAEELELLPEPGEPTPAPEDLVPEGLAPIDLEAAEVAAAAPPVPSDEDAPEVEIVPELDEPPTEVEPASSDEGVLPGEVESLPDEAEAMRTPEETGYSAAEVLDQFKKKVEEQVRPDEITAHYDLGLAYKEMGLIDEAIAEFRTALDSARGPRTVEVLTVLGISLGLRGQAREAVDCFRRALESGHAGPEAVHALCYELGAAHEALGEPEAAISWFRRAGEGGTYRDAASRASRLEGARPPEAAEGSPPTADEPAPPAARRGPKKNIGFV